MPVFRVQKNRSYTTMSNIHLRDKTLSLKAKGLLSQMLSLPDNWIYSISGLASINRESRDSIRTAITELEKCGYIVRRRIRGENGKLGEMEYIVYERPVSGDPILEEPEEEKPVQEKPMLENPTLVNPTQAKPTQVKPAQEKPALDNAAQINTKQTKTEKTNKDPSSKEVSGRDPVRQNDQSQEGRSFSDNAKHSYGEFLNVRLSDTDMEKLKKRFPDDFKIRIQRLSEYMESTGKTYRNHYLTICQWARRDEERKASMGHKDGFENYDCGKGESY